MVARARGNIPLPDSTGLFSKMPAEADYLSNLTIRLGQELNARSADDAARVSLLLQSPSGSVYALFVNDLGVLTTTKVSGGG